MKVYLVFGVNGNDLTVTAAKFVNNAGLLELYDDAGAIIGVFPVGSWHGIYGGKTA